MGDDKLPAKTFTSKAGDAARSGARPAAGGRAGIPAATHRTVGVYERPAAGRAKLSAPLLIILILAALVSAVATARFLF